MFRQYAGRIQGYAAFYGAKRIRRIKRSDMQIKVVGYVRGKIRNHADYPRHGRGDMPACNIEIEEDFVPALNRLRAGQDIVVLTWPHQARGDVKRSRSGNRFSSHVHGVPGSRSVFRPDPIGLHEVRVLEIQKSGLTVTPMEVIDGTPVIDIRPVFSSRTQADLIQKFFSSGEIHALIHAARQGWERGLFSGTNGNLSIRKDEFVLITRSGCSKGCLTPDDLCVLRLDSAELLAGEPPSIESGMHLAVYHAQASASAVVHTHPVHLLALGSLPGELFSLLDNFESLELKKDLRVIGAIKPGSVELAEAVGAVSAQSESMFMPRHGLVCWSRDLYHAMSRSEELESLARIEINQRLLRI